MAAINLHYIYDPLCGWCYGATPLALAAHQMPDVELVLHGGGMMTGSNRRQVTPQWHDYVIPHDQRIAALTGQPFGQPYYAGLLRDTSVMLDSAPPTAAILAARRLADKGVEMLHRVQQAHYEEGRKIADIQVLIPCAESIGLDAAAFVTEFAFVSAERLTQHITESRSLLATVGGQGFPTFALALPHGRWQVMPTSEFLGKPEAWCDYLSQQINQVNP